MVSSGDRASTLGGKYCTEGEVETKQEDEQEIHPTRATHGHQKIADGQDKNKLSPVAMGSKQG